MTAYQPIQTAGNYWPPISATMLHEIPSAPPSFSASKQDNSLRAELERAWSPASDQDALLAEIRKVFVTPADSPVARLLFERRALPEVLLQATPQLKACFGPETVFALRAPIDESGWRTLYAVAIWHGSVRDVRNALERFDNTWWIAHSRQAAGYLTFTYELV